MGIETQSRPGVLIVSSGFSALERGYRSVCEDLADHLDDRGFSVIRTSSQQTRIPRFVDMLATVIAQRRAYDVVQIDTYSGNAFIWAEAVGMVLRAMSKPYILTLHGGNLPQFARAHSRRVRRLFEHAHIVTTPSGYLKSLMTDYRTDILEVPNPLSIQAYSFRQREPITPRLVWLRSLHAVYNPLMAVEVLAALSETYPQARLTMIGPDKGDGMLSAVEGAARARGVDSRLELTGGVASSTVPGLLDQHDIFLNTSTIDNTPLSVIEAHACGLPVVSTDVGGLPFLLRHEEDALLVPSGDAAAMVTAVKRLLEEPDLGARLALEGYRKVQQFDWNVLLPRWEQLLLQVAGR